MASRPITSAFGFTDFDKNFSNDYERKSMTEQNELETRIQALWQHRAGADRPSAEDAVATTTGRFLSRLKARRRAASFGLATVAIAFASLTILSIVICFTQDDLSLRHGILFTLFNTICWAGWFVGWQMYRRADSISIVPSLTVVEALRVGQSQVLRHRRQLSLIAIGLVVSIPLVIWSLWMMVERQRVTVDELPWRIGFALIAYAIAFACLAADRFGRNRREWTEIDSLMADIQEADRRAEQ